MAIFGQLFHFAMIHVFHAAGSRKLDFDLFLGIDGAIARARKFAGSVFGQQVG